MVDRPESLCGNDTGSFAYITIRDRMPEILTKVIDVFSRLASKYQSLGQQDNGEDAKEVIARLSKLKNEMQTDKEVIEVSDSYSDANIWNEFVQKMACLRDGETVPSWFSSPWLSIECYLYRRIFEAMQLSQYHKDFDPFAEQKEKAFYSSNEPMATLANYVIQFSKSQPATIEEAEDRKQLRLDFEMLFEYCLWGNKCDLSLSGGTQVTNQLTESSQLKNLLEHILANDTERVWKHILVAESRANGHARLDFILDNAGFELYTDLCLAEFVLDKKLFDTVHFHVKDIPWFVSDTSRKDFLWTIKQCQQAKDDATRELGKRWAGRVKEGTFVIREHPYWTCGSDYAAMKDLVPELYEELSKSQLIIFKGDLNYRKLIGDRNWSHTTPFSEALWGFCPAPLCALRTLKADLVVGLKEGKDAEAEARDKKWMVNGQFAVIEFCEKL